MSQRVLATKLHLPSWRAGNVTRPNLVAMLQNGMEAGRKLALVSAPAGYGKTTLAAEWAHALAGKRRVAWLSLDEADNQPARFFAHGLAALDGVQPGLAAGLQWLADAAQPPPQPFLDDLLNALAGLDEPLLLVLDDYHVVEAPALHAAVGYCVEHLPPQVHLLLTTRVDPPLPLARLRARGQLTEVRGQQLRFAPGEVRTFFTQTMDLALDAATLDVVAARTEGWAAGLQLAGLALQKLPDPQAFVTAFGGSHRYVLDYLADEVMRQLGPETRAFLVKSSVLARFNGDLCAALTGERDSQALLQQLEQANLFVVPLDDARGWYRYHHLFADYLRTLMSRAEAAALSRQAATWCQAHGFVDEAVSYALAAADPEFLAEMVAAALAQNTTWSGGNVALLLSWLDALPVEAVALRPAFGLDASRVFYLAGRFDLAERCLDQAEAELLAAAPAAERAELLAMAAIYRGAIAAVRGDVKRAIDLTRSAQAQLPRRYHLVHARGFFSLGLAYELDGASVAAAEIYLQAAAEAEAAGVLFLALHARGSAAQVQIVQGQLGLAEATCRSAFELAGGARLPPLGLVAILRGAIALERNELAAAASLLQEGTALARAGGLTDDLSLGLTQHARLCIARGDRSSALAAVGEAEALMHAFDVPRMVLRAGACLARLHLALGRTQEAAQWAAAANAAGIALEAEYEALTLARVQLATGAHAVLLTTLPSLLDRATAAGRGQSAMEAMLLLGLAHRAAGNVQAATTWLGQALQLAVPEGYMRIFLDEGVALAGLLPAVHPYAPSLVERLLAATSDTPSSPQAILLPETLSEQELRVLRLIVAGKSNREIAAELVITPGTAKWHVHNVLQKLGVNNRPQAIARARALGIG